jgi:hypothetical protein
MFCPSLQLLVVCAKFETEMSRTLNRAWQNLPNHIWHEFYSSTSWRKSSHKVRTTKSLCLISILEVVGPISDGNWP